VQQGDRRALARAITLIESTRSDHTADAAALLDAVLPVTGNAARVGISGPPGVGKSTFIEALGLRLCAADHRVAVLAVDPSSARGGGSILGDKTRMDELARQPNAYIRPSPSGGALGGVTRRTREAILVCEAAGFDVVLVETVGVGQSEIDVDGMVDTFVLLVAAGGGDELQGIKRGVMELADIVAVTKADGDLLPAAQRAAADYRHALHLLRPKHQGWTAEVVLSSASTGDGIDEVWSAVTSHREALVASGALTERRAEQARVWLWGEVRNQLLQRLQSDPHLAAQLGDVEQAVADGSLSALSAAAKVLGSLAR
jgi:LAO/AO transport system kinase